LIAKGQESHCDTEELQDQSALDEAVLAASAKANEATSQYNALLAELKSDEGSSKGSPKSKPKPRRISRRP
jgi:hypothetical protein